MLRISGGVDVMRACGARALRWWSVWLCFDGRGCRRGQTPPWPKPVLRSTLRLGRPAMQSIVGRTPSLASVEFSRGLIDTSGYDRAGFAARYDRFRPRPPQALLDVLSRYARAERPALVVDLGCGTGLSTRAWSNVAERTIGIDRKSVV